MHWSEAVTHFDGLVQERRYSIANALEVGLSSTDPSICILSLLKAGMANKSLNPGKYSTSTKTQYIMKKIDIKYLMAMKTGKGHKLFLRIRQVNHSNFTWG